MITLWWNRGGGFIPFSAGCHMFSNSSINNHSTHHLVGYSIDSSSHGVLLLAVWYAVAWAMLFVMLAVVAVELAMLATVLAVVVATLVVVVAGHTGFFVDHAGCCVGHAGRCVGHVGHSIGHAARCGTNC